MSLKWIDVLEIAIQLAESKPEVDPRYVNFVDLHRWVLALPDFSDDPSRGGEGARGHPGGLDRRSRLSARCRLGNPLEPAYNSRV